MVKFAYLVSIPSESSKIFFIIFFRNQSLKHKIICRIKVSVKVAVPPAFVFGTHFFSDIYRAAAALGNAYLRAAGVVVKFCSGDKAVH